MVPEIIHTTPTEGHWKFLLEGQYEAKLEFPGGVGVQNKRSSVRGVWIFSGTTQWLWTPHLSE